MIEKRFTGYVVHLSKLFETTDVPLSTVTDCTKTKMMDYVNVLVLRPKASIETLV